MNNDFLSTARLSIAAVVLCALLAVAGCGSSPGPSNKEVRLDLLDQANQIYHGLLVSDDFSVTDSQVQTENRVKYHVTVSYKVDPQKAAAAKRSSQLIGYTNDTLRKARRNEGKDQELTVLYKRSGQGVWQIARIQSGYQ